MLRPSIIALSLLIAVGFTACSSAYRRMYSPQRSYFKPEKEKPTEVLPTTPTGTGAGAPTVPPAQPEQPPGLPGL